MPDGSGPQGVLVHVPLWPGHSEEALWVLELENVGRAEPRPTPWMVQEEDGVETAREIQGSMMMLMANGGGREVAPYVKVSQGLS